MDFVHGQMTADLRGAGVPGLVPAAFLNVRGQLEHFAWIYRRAEDVYLHLSAGEAEALAGRLRRYVIFDQVEVQDLSDTLRTVHLWRPEAPGWDTAGGAAQELTLGGAAVLAGRVPRGAEGGGLDLHYLARDEEAVLGALGGEERPLAELDRARIEAGIPDPVRDGFVRALPPEIGLDVGGPLPSISYRKGCYVGQEIMARLEARGKARYHLVRLRAPAPGGLGALGPGTELRDAGGKVVGEAGLSTGDTALARLRREVASGESVSFGEGASGGAARVEWLAPA